MKNLSLILTILLLACKSGPSTDNTVKLLFDIDQSIHKEKNEVQIKLDTLLLQVGNEIINLPTPEFKVVGRRLLTTSRIYLKRISYLGYAYQLTHEQKYASKAEELMLAAASFPHWNPSHYLDVAEMTMALSIGLGWTRKGLSEEAVQQVEEAIIHMGLLPSVDEPRGFLTNTNNWNQVCNASMALGAMAVYHQIPGLADSIIFRTKKNIAIPEALYAPDGIYPEGGMYWEYGTAFHTLFLDAYRNFYPDSTLMVSDPFLKSKDFIFHVTGPAGNFNFFDNRTNLGISAPFIWISGYTGAYTTMVFQKEYIEQFIRGKRTLEAEGQSHRLFPFILLWLKKEMLEETDSEIAINWYGQGVNPVSVHRSGWDKNDVFLAVKGGSPILSHGHMDIGSFVLDAHGKRWVMDLGMHGYHALESQGVNIWDNKQDGERWQVFRYTNHAHSTLVIDNKCQRVDGKGLITKVVDDENNQSTQLDLSEVYAPSATRVTRNVALVDKTKVVVIDKLVNNSDQSAVRWAFPTSSEIEIKNKSEAILKQENETILVKLIHPSTATLQTFSAQPQNDFEDNNPGILMLGFEHEMPPNKEVTLKIEFFLE